MLKFLSAQAAEIISEVRYLAGSQYPWFVTRPCPEWTLNQIPVFTYHGVEPAGFNRELRFLADNGYQTITARDFYSFLTLTRDALGKEVLLTFDDGYKTVWTEGAPLLQEYNFRAIAFIVPGYVGQPGYLTWGDIQQMRESDLFDIQSHTMNHNAEICSTATDIPAIEYELSESKRQIEEHLPGHCVEHLCYPEGLGSQPAAEISRRLGYKTNFWSVRLDRALNRPGDDPYKIVRLKHDYILRLPGVGRRSMVSIFSDKALRRVKGKPFEF